MSLTDLLQIALEARAARIESWHSEDSNCYRLFHGAAEGFPGLSIDRTGSVLLIQTDKYPLEPGELESITELYRDQLDASLRPCWNHYGRPLDLPRWHRPLLPTPCTGRELGLSFEVSPRHDAPSPLFTLEMRAARRWMAQEASGASVLSLFAGSCTLGVTAAVHGATEVWNVDRAPSALRWGKKNANLNAMGRARIRWIESDCVPVLRQLAGMSVRLREGKAIEFPKMGPRQFDRVLLDPAHGDQGPFGAVDLVKDYDALLAPALKCVRSGGKLLAVQPVAAIDREDWIRQLLRVAERTATDVDFHVVHPEMDFPSAEAGPALKMVVLEVR